MPTQDKIPDYTEVACVVHNGEHTGLLVHDLGFAYGVRWNFANVPANRVHLPWSTATPYDAVRPVNGSDPLRLKIDEVALDIVEQVRRWEAGEIKPRSGRDWISGMLHTYELLVGVNGTDAALEHARRTAAAAVTAPDEEEG
jgi:hypothetical protein